MSEESAFQDVEPATPDTESFLGVLPGPSYWLARGPSDTIELLIDALPTNP